MASQVIAEPRRSRGGAADREAATLRVFGVVAEPMSAVGYVRFFQPFARLAPMGVELACLGSSLELSRGPLGYEPDPAILEGIDLLVFPQMVASPVMPDGRRVRLVEALCREAAWRRIPIVYSVDDQLDDLDELNPAYETIRDSIDNRRLILQRAEAIFVTTRPLAEALAGTGLPIHLLPNAIDPGHWSERPRRGDGLRIGWTGSSSHLDDLLMLLPAIEAVQRRVECTFVLQGLSDRPLERQRLEIAAQRHGFSSAQHERAERFEELVRRLEPLRHVHLPFRPTREFFGLLPELDLDIGLCPLLDTSFNRHKSANKFYEYAVTGSMTLASRVTPYLEEVSVTVPNDARSWSEAIEHFLRDAPSREAEWAAQRDFVLAERNIETLKHEWDRALRSLPTGRREGAEP